MNLVSSYACVEKDERSLAKFEQEGTIYVLNRISHTTGLLFAAAALCTAQVTFTEYALPSGGAPYVITAGPDGNTWFTEPSGNRIGKITPAGLITEFTIPTLGSLPIGIARGPDGNLWFTEATASKIGRISPSGVFAEFPLSPGRYPYGIVAGPDGNLWFAEADGNRIGRITTAGIITEFPLPSPGSGPNFIAVGSDGNLWFAEDAGNRIGRITTSGVITEFPVATPGSSPSFLNSGPDGNLWFVEYPVNRIGRISVGGVITEFAIPTPGSIPEAIATGPDGNLWFAEEIGKIARITPSGVITEFPIPSGAAAVGITMGPDGSLWFTESFANRIGKAAVCSAPIITTLSASPSLLWPPNHKMVSVNLAQSVSGGCGLVACQIVSVTSTEPAGGDPDWVITGNLTLSLRATRLGNGPGRTYTITVKCTDGSGNQATRTVTVIVPHDQGQ